MACTGKDLQRENWNQHLEGGWNVGKYVEVWKDISATDNVIKSREAETHVSVQRTLSKTPLAGVDG